MVYRDQNMKAKIVACYSISFAWSNHVIKMNSNSDNYSQFPRDDVYPIFISSNEALIFYATKVGL